MLKYEVMALLTPLNPTRGEVGANSGFLPAGSHPFESLIINHAVFSY
jgi:hypothetical protein